MLAAGSTRHRRDFPFKSAHCVRKLHSRALKGEACALVSSYSGTDPSDPLGPVVVSSSAMELAASPLLSARDGAFFCGQRRIAAASASKVP